MTQAYFTELLEKDYLEDVEPSLGRFRAFLKVSVKHFLSKERDKANALKQGGQLKIISLDVDDVEAGPFPGWNNVPTGKRNLFGENRL